MIQAVFYRNSDDKLFGFELTGHAGFKRAGKDIVCAAVSALALNTVNAAEKLTDAEFEGEQGKSGKLEFRFTSPLGEREQLLMDALELGLKGIQTEYGTKYLEISYTSYREV